MKFPSFYSLILLLTITIGLFSFSSDAKPQMAVMAYYVPSDTYLPKDIPFEKLTHIIFSFTQVIDHKMAFKNEDHSERLKELVGYKRLYPHLKVMIACGGWSGSGGFSDMANDPDLRKGFVKSTIKFVTEYNLDGVDIDWEYPGLEGAGNTYREEDKENFTALMKELRVALDSTKKGMVLSFASAGWEKYYDQIQTREVMKYADYMNIMTYDFVGGSTPFTAHHTNLGTIPLGDIKDTPALKITKEKGYRYKPRSIKNIVDFCRKLGISPKKIVIGAAFYGRGWKGVPPENNGLYQTNKGVWQSWANYRDIKENYENKNGFKKYWDASAQAPYLYHANDNIFISYDDAESVALKTGFVKESGLGGIMFWQLTLDSTENGLLDAIHKKVAKKD